MKYRFLFLGGFFVKALVAVARRPYVKVSTTDQLYRDD